jgi:hypothetical protein
MSSTGGGDQLAARYGWDTVLLETGKVLALKEQIPDLVILPAHDPTAAQRLPQSR